MKYTWAIIMLFLLGACTIAGLTNDYKQLGETQKNDIVPFHEGNEPQVGKIYTINGKQLVNEMKKYPKSLVYVFKNGCVSDLCKPMSVYEDYAKMYNYKLFLVMRGFGNLTETTDQPLENPLFAIDGDFYQKKFRAKYERYFENDLQGFPTAAKASEYHGNLFFFIGNQLDTICRELPENKIITPSF